MSSSTSVSTGKDDNKRPLAEQEKDIVVHVYTRDPVTGKREVTVVTLPKKHGGR